MRYFKKRETTPTPKRFHSKNIDLIHRFDSRFAVKCFFQMEIIRNNEISI